MESSRLVRIANEQDFSLLAHLIDMVVLEAWREATESDPFSTDEARPPGDGA